MTARVGCAILGPGNIGTDLLLKIQGQPGPLEVLWMVGVDPASEGLARARERGVPTLHSGIEGLLEAPNFGDVRIVFDATTASAHAHHAALLEPRGVRVIDLTPAGRGPGVVPVANLQQHLDAPNVSLVTCGGQATIPIVHAASQVGTVAAAEIVATIASRSAGPGTRANIDEFTVATARALQTIGGAARGKAIIVLNPAEPPIAMRDTVHLLVTDTDPTALHDAIVARVEAVRAYVPGYRLVQPPVIHDRRTDPVRLPDGTLLAGYHVVVLLEVQGNGDWLPAYSGNLDIMTAAARATAVAMASHLLTRTA